MHNLYIALPLILLIPILECSQTRGQRRRDRWTGQVKFRQHRKKRRLLSTLDQNLVQLFSRCIRLHKAALTFVTLLAFFQISMECGITWACNTFISDCYIHRILVPGILHECSAMQSDWQMFSICHVWLHNCVYLQIKVLIATDVNTFWSFFCLLHPRVVYKLYVYYIYMYCAQSNLWSIDMSLKVCFCFFCYSCYSFVCGD